MTTGSVDPAKVPPVLVLGLGNVLLGDDGVGPFLVEALARKYGDREAEAEFLDGGTQGMALLGRLSGRKAVVILDALALENEPGTVSVLEGQQVLRLATTRATTAHEGNAGELLAVASILGDLPARVLLVGVEPKWLDTGMGLSEDVQRAVPVALGWAQKIVDELLAGVDQAVYT